jgi:hypothetical protein
MRAQLSIRDYEQLSAYLDGQLSIAEKRRLEARLNEQPELRSALEELGETRSLLRMAPRKRAPRNFTLTPSMVRESQPQRRSLLNMFPALSFASALAALALVFSFLFELSPGVSSRMAGASPAADQANQESMTLMQEQPAEDAAERSAAPADGAPEIMAAPQSDESVPPGITWGQPGYSDPYGSVLGKGSGPEMGGMGGDGGFGVGGGAPDGRILIPPQAAESLDEQKSTNELQAEDMFAGVPTLEGNGPILGVPEPDRQGLYAVEPGTALPPSPEYSAGPTSNESVDSVEPIPALRIAQVILGALALITGLAAFFIWRKTH